MAWWTPPYVGWTHLPTGLRARSNTHYGRARAAIRVMSRQARAMLAAMVWMRNRDPAWREGCYPGRERVRTYDLRPLLGIPPHIRSRGAYTTHEFSGRYDAPVTPDVLDRLMLERRRIVDGEPVGLPGPSRRAVRDTGGVAFP